MTKFQDSLKFLNKFTPKHFWSWIVRNENIEKFAFNFDISVRDDIKSKFQFDGALLDIFSENSGPVIHKWHHYIPIYSEVFSFFRNKPIHVLEIGVGKGGGLKMWREYFGPEAKIYGIDIDEKCSEYDGLYGTVRIGSQSDLTFLERVFEEMGRIDIVIDDGSHHMKDLRKSFEFLFPKIEYGGVYLIEDLHTSFWRSAGGGFYSRKNFLRQMNNYVLGMHHWYHSGARKRYSIGKEVGSIHIFDSIVVFRKSKSYPPTHSQRGSSFY